MATLNAEEIEALAVGVSKAAIAAIDAERKRATERIYTVKLIAIEAGVSERQLQYFVKQQGFPLDRDPRGYFVLRWNLERWFDAKRRAVSGFRGGTKKIV